MLSSSFDGSTQFAFSHDFKLATTMAVQRGGKWGNMPQAPAAQEPLNDWFSMLNIYDHLAG
jgi:hypothetical protein